MSLFEADEEIKEFEGNESPNLSNSSQESNRFAIKSLQNFCKNIYTEELEDVIPKIESNPKSVYNFIKKYQKHEQKRNVGIRTVKMRLSYIKPFLRRNGIEVDDEQVKKCLEKTPKYLRKGVKSEEIAKVVIHCEKMVKAIVMLQATSGMRISEILKLKKGDFERKDRWQINIKAENTKTREQRITYISEEASEYVEPFLEGKSEEKVFDISKSGVVAHLSKAVKRAGLGRKYDHSGCLEITSHSFRAFFITQMGKAEGFFGHAMSGHAHYMKEYDRYSPEEILEKYIEFEDNIKIFNRENNIKDKKISELQKQVEDLLRFKDQFKGMKLKLEDF